VLACSMSMLGSILSAVMPGLLDCEAIFFVKAIFGSYSRSHYEASSA
jgi:hypothetical protein